MNTEEKETVIKAALLIAILSCSAAARADGPIGLFENHSDVGKPSHAGSVEYNPANQTYVITGGGKNMWGSEDAFHFVWRRMSGDVSLAATIHWPAPGKEPHRKACLLIRQSLEPDSAYVDAALHGDGLTSLQFRKAASERTYEIQSNASRPARIRIEKQGDRFFMSVAAKDQPLHHAGGSIKIPLKEPFYVGLGVCAHNFTRGSSTTVTISTTKLVRTTPTAKNNVTPCTMK